MSDKAEWEEIGLIPEAYDLAGIKTWASMMRCNQCGFITFAIERHFAQYGFCPSCGADMRGEAEPKINPIVNITVPQEQIQDAVDKTVEKMKAELEPCDFCKHKDDCGYMAIYCPSERRTE